MAVMLILYLVISAVSIVIGSMKYANDTRKSGKGAILLYLAAGLVMFIGVFFAGNTAKTGYYKYVVNGVTTSQGAVSAMEALVIGISAGAVPNFISMSIGSMIAKARRKRADGDRSISKFGKIVCVLCFLEVVGGIGLLVTSYALNLGYIIPIAAGTVFFLVIATLLAAKWRRGNKNAENT